MKAKSTVAQAAAHLRSLGITSLVYYIVVRNTWGWSRAKALPLLVLFMLRRRRVNRSK